ncbi:ribonuclease R family protein [Geitlerinema sp. PCC 9228]|uniref:ribonuclease catalytic domain-containing protein n=1 Tax=Geitlerinema sp. PCC 9228 TaxID=111611 RepID=UPI0008F98AEC|nr:ribonuclease R family protein [Geitlerinema sp. PCC 9228]
MEKGNLIEFRQDGDRRLAVVERPEGKKHWIVTDERGQSHTVHPRQVTYVVPGGDYTPEDIPSFQQQVEAYWDPSSLEVAWEFLDSDTGTIAPEELSELLFSDQQPAQCYAAYYLLSEDKLYFKQKGNNRYEPRSATQVADLKHQQEVAIQKQKELEEFLERVRQALEGESVEWTASDRPRLEALEKLAAVGEEPSGRTARDILAILERPETSEAAFQLLVDLGLWSPHENLFLRRSQIPTQFPAKVLEVAQQYLDSPLADRDRNRLDLTHLKVYTIDDESTQEIDDGVSIEYLEDGTERIWVHIADPSRWIFPGDELDVEARRRSTTLYLPTGMIPMFPEALATGPMSLVQGKECPALSFGVILDADGAIADYTIAPSTIVPTYRLTYEDVDEMLDLGVQAEPEILAIGKWAEIRHSWRQKQGAISISMPECSIKVSDDDNISIQVIEDSPARRAVAEMMILTGEVAACYGEQNQLAIPYRQQQQPELPPEEELMQLPAGAVRSSAMRRCMPRSETSLTPGRHASLGLDRYAQVTSPIRRYSDLLAHFQLKAHLRGEEPPFSPEQVQEIVASVSAAAQEATQVERQTNRYWGLEYLRRQGDTVWQALMLRWLRPDDNLGAILLEELGLELPMRFTRSIQPGDRLEVRVTYADPRQEMVRFQEALVQQAAGL